MKKHVEQLVDQQPKGFVASLEALSDDLLQLVADDEPKVSQDEETLY